MGQKETRAYNFNAGPSALPLPVLEKAQEELVNFRNSGMSVMELSHRSALYEDVHNEAKQLLKELLAIPDNYEVLFLQGGGSLQFSMVPMNFLATGKKAGYVLTGTWSEKALKEAQVLKQDVYIAGSTKEEAYTRIPSFDELRYDADSAYLHITSNNTIYGSQWRQFPNTGTVPLIADMSSDILSRPIDVSQFGLIYAGAQKNLGPSGVTVVIIRQDLLEQANKDIPTMLRYDIHAKNNSLYNTPPTFGIYMLGLVLKWAKELGGVQALEKQNQEKAQLIYDMIDRSEGFYKGHVTDLASRSLMNITFRLRTEELEKEFLAQAKQAGFVGLNGHRSVGGCRASTYNAVPYESCKALRDFMEDFYRKHA
jgi:phosphoserine aminotransferase